MLNRIIRFIKNKLFGVSKIRSLNLMVKASEENEKEGNDG
jgi:hypothetical protein